MLRSISVKNFAIIDNIQIDFNDHMSVLTGETGAGKSLIIDAIGLLFGDRASSELVRRNESKASVEGVFDNLEDSDYFLAENEIEKEDFLVIRRDIYENGKSICKINGEAVSLNLLSDLGSILGSIHTQFDNEKLTNPKNYFDFIDTSEIKHDIDEYSRMLKIYNAKKRELDNLLKTESENNQKLDFLKYQEEELKKANLSVKEEDELKNRANILNNHEKIASNINSFLEIYDNDEILEKIYESINYLDKVKEYDEGVNKIKESMYDSYYNLSDAIDTIKSSFKTSELDLDELDEINNRLGVYSDIKRKYKMQTEEIVELYLSLNEKIQAIENFDEIRSDLEKEVKDYKDKLLKIALTISDLRKKQAKEIEQEIKVNLNDLQLSQTELKIYINSNPDRFLKNGIDEVEISVTFNKGEAMRSLHKVASGGELSRFMLALKAITSKKFVSKTLIFDEIDSGVSGSVAYSLATKIASISKYAQVLCVTHLVQVASIADHQLFIYKTVEDGRTKTFIKELNYDERVLEISKMASNGEVSDASIELAKELLKK